MARKPRERELTREEAIEQARLQLSPLWVPNPPLLAGALTPNGPQAFPIDDSFLKKRWVILVVDPTAGSTEDHLISWKELVRRYKGYNLDFLLLLSSPHPFYTDPVGLEGVVAHYKAGEILAVDPDGALIAALRNGKTKLPFAWAMDLGKLVGSGEGAEWFESLEPELHRFLRRDDPGLALLPFLPRGRSWIDDLPGWDFFSELAKAKDRAFQASVDLVLRERKIVVEDPKTVIRFSSPGSEVSLVAETAEISGRAGEIIVEVNGRPPKDAQWSEDLVRSDVGLPCVRAGKARLYLALTELPAGAREITLKFPNADRTPAALYGVRFSNLRAAPPVT